MTTTDRRDADDATFAAEMDRLNRLEVADPWRDQIEHVLASHALAAFTGDESACRCDRRWRPNTEYRDHLADVIAALKPAPGTDVHDCARCDGTGCESDDSADERSYPCQACNGSGVRPAPGTDSSGQAVQRVLDLADELEQNRGALISHAGAARHIRAAVAGPQRDHGGEGA